MNFAAHVLVAHDPGDTPGAPGLGRLLGAAAPDLTRLAGTPLADDLDADVRVGIACHHAADAAFHELAWFRRSCASLAALLADRGVRRGPARAAAHVTIELLLDGAVLADPDCSRAFEPAWAALVRGDDRAVGLARADARPDWRAFLDEFTTRLDPWSYADPLYTADRVAGTLRRRPRLALSPGEHQSVRAVAGPTQVEVAAAAPGVIAHVRARLRA